MQKKHMSFKLSVLALLFSSVAMAETVTVPATVTVDNTIDFTVTGALDFGIIRAIPSTAATECAVLTVPANPASAPNATPGAAALAACPTAGPAVIQSIGGTIQRPQFTVAGVPPFTALTLTLPTAPVVLALNPAPPGAPAFNLYDFTAFQTTGTPGAVTTTVTANATGNIGFSVGATITTDPGTPTIANYENIAYAGEFEVEVAY